MVVTVIALEGHRNHAHALAPRDGEMTVLDATKPSGVTIGTRWCTIRTASCYSRHHGRYGCMLAPSCAKTKAGGVGGGRLSQVVSV